MTLSPKAIDLLLAMFNPQSNINLPAGVAWEVVEIHQFAQAMKAALPKPPEA